MKISLELAWYTECHSIGKADFSFPFVFLCTLCFAFTFLYYWFYLYNFQFFFSFFVLERELIGEELGTRKEYDQNI